MKKVLGIGLIALGICLGLYVGGYLMFIGGIVQVVSSITPVVIPPGIAFGIVKIMFSGLVGWIIGLIPVTIGGAILY